LETRLKKSEKLFLTDQFAMAVY